ncbi:MAG: PilZ domain-containing protein [Spirochaetales bacterium]|jgi:c-di-GMP-binding flagellar brake protein YcgR|nr:PilZ domain-containing protein [Spirochaetales bacterium]
MGAVFIILGCIVFFLMILVMRGGGLGFPWVEFYLRGKESGFGFGEINVLRKVALENRMKDPAALYWSIRQLDRCIRGSILRIRSRGKLDDLESTRFLQKLFNFRKQVEFNQPKYRSGLRSSRNMLKGQKVRIPIPGVGVFESQVVENMRQYITLAHPRGTNRLPPGHSWRNMKIDVFFWRVEDAEYYFETQVIEDLYDKKEPALHIAHSDNLIRAQKRGSVRLNISQPVSLYPLRGIEAANEIIETRQGYKGRMIDLSEDGFAVRVGGKAKAGIPVKIQLALGDDFIIMCGTVRNVTYNQKVNQSALHAQAVKPSDKMRISILTQVYGIFSAQDIPEKSAAEDVAAGEQNPDAGQKTQNDGGLSWDDI